MQAKRDLLSAGLTEAAFTVFRPTGTYFVTVDIRPLGAWNGDPPRTELVFISLGDDADPDAVRGRLEAATSR